MGLPKLPPQSGGGQNQPRAATHSLQVNLTGMPVDKLLELRAKIDEKLPAQALKDLNLEQELVLQLLTMQKLQRDVLVDTDIPANQRSQVASGVAAILAQLVKLQGDVYTSERLKKVEQILAEVVRGLPVAQQEEWLESYRSALGVRA